MTLPVPLGDLIRDGKLLWLYCRECFRERDVDPSTMPLPPNVPVPEIGKRMKCSSCGSRKIDSRSELYPGGIEAQRSRRLLFGAHATAPMASISSSLQALVFAGAGTEEP
jgi:hypothetical protein